MNLYALPFEDDKVVVKAHILDRGLALNDQGLARVFLNNATAQTGQGKPLDFDGRGVICLDVPLDRIPGLDQLSPPAGGHVFAFSKVAISHKERSLADALVPENYSAYQLDKISLG